MKMKLLSLSNISVVLLLSLMISCTSNKVKVTKRPAEKPTNQQETIVNTNDIDAARNVSYMTTREKDMVKEINLIRSNPKGYIPIIEAYIQEQEASLSQVVSGKQYIKDEIKTAKELIKELKNTDAMPILQPHEGVYKAAQVHGDEGKRKGRLDHVGKDGKWPWDRIKAYAGFNNGGENLVGGLQDVRKSVIVLLIDSGIPNRGHRKALLNPAWKYVACYEVGQVGDMPYYWVQNFAF